MSRILVTGGTGVLGRRVVTQLQSANQTVRIMSRHSRPAGLAAGLEWAQAEIETGNGLREALADAQTIIHAASSPMKRTHAVDVDGTRRLLELARAAGVSHFVYISIVGIDRIPYPYYRHKLAAENLIVNGSVPWTILRTTQFYDLLDLALYQLTKLPVALLPTDLQFQPMDSVEAANALCQCALTEPAGRVPDMGGPEVLRVAELARTWLAARGLRRTIVPVHLPGQIAHGFRNGYNTCPQNRQGKMTWNEWLQRKYGARPSRTETQLSERNPT